MPSDYRNERPRLDDILAGSAGGFDSFDDLWNNTEAAPDDEPLPAGMYKCLVVSGGLSRSKGKGTPTYKLTLEVIEPHAFARRRVWADIWITPLSIERSKRELAKLGVITPAQVREPLRPGIVVDAKGVQKTLDDGRVFNEVKQFTVISDGPPPGALDPDEDDDARGVPF